MGREPTEPRPTSVIVTVSTLTTCPLNSVLAKKNRPSALKSPWSTPGHGMLTLLRNVQSLEALGHDDGLAAVGGEREVVGVGDRDGAGGAAGAWVDHRQAVPSVLLTYSSVRSHDGVT